MTATPLTTGPITSSEPIRFSATLREATATAHQDAERSAFVHRLFRGHLPMAAVTDLTAQLWFVYSALESVGTELATDRVAAGFARPELSRVPALEADLSVMAGADWRDTVRELPATGRYVERIRASVENPERFVAHHYTRLLGDLSGGQMIRRTLARHYGDQIAGALSFYDLDHLGDLTAYKDAYRQRLDEAPWDEVQRAAVVDEANRAFAANAAIFADLGGAHGARSGHAGGDPTP